MRLERFKSNPLIPLSAVALFVFAVAALRIYSASNAEVMRSYPADDAFYYLEIARHFPSLQFTRGISTTGFHPLYWLFLVPVQGVFSGINAVRATLILDVIFHCASGFALFALLRKHWRTSTAVIVAATWIALPFERNLSLMGVETSLSLLILLGFLLAIERYTAMPDSSTAAIVGLLAALSYLARTDSIFLTIPVLIAVAVANRRSLKLHHVVWCLGIGLLFSLPWYAVLITHHSATTSDSARALRLLRHQGVFSFDQVGDTIRLLYQALYSVFDRTVFTNVLGVWHAVAILGVVLALGFFGRTRNSWQAWETGLLAGAVILYFLYATILGGMRPWYLGYWALVLILLVAPVVAQWVTDVATPNAAAIRVAALLAAIFIVVIALVPPSRPFPEERDKYLAADAMRTAVPVGQNIASMNAGIYGYFSNHKVFDLDGVVNPKVDDSLKNNSVCQYLKANNVQWYIDEPTSYAVLVAHAPGLHFGNEVTLSDQWSSSGVVQRQVLSKLDTSAC